MSRTTAEAEYADVRLSTRSRCAPTIVGPEQERRRRPTRSGWQLSVQVQVIRLLSWRQKNEGRRYRSWFDRGLSAASGWVRTKSPAVWAAREEDAERRRSRTGQDRFAATLG